MKGGINLTQNERIKLLREHLDLSQEAFGEAIGLVKSSISNIEKGTRNVTDKHIKLICNEFKVNEEWLRTGAGGPDNMFLPNDAALLMNMGKLADSDNRFKKFCVETLMNAPDEFFDYIYKEFLKFEKIEKKEKE